jgi:hypothetical protein
MNTDSDLQPLADSHVDRPEPSASGRGGRIRFAALLAALAAAVAAFGAFVLPRAATDASLASEQAGGPGYAVVVDYDYRTLDRGGGCDRRDSTLTADPAQQT